MILCSVHKTCAYHTFWSAQHSRNSEPYDLPRSLQLCAVLAARHPEDFAARATTIKGRKRHYFAPSPDRMINPAPIEGAELYVETNLSAKDTIKLCHRLLDALGEESQAFDLTYAHAGDNAVTA